jgi:chaperonin GroES
MKALHDNIIVIPDKQPEKIGSILMPESKKKERTHFGTVISVGKENKDIKTGQRVLFSKFHGTEFEINGIRHLTLEKDEIDAILT